MSRAGAILLLLLALGCAHEPPRDEHRYREILDARTPEIPFEEGQALSLVQTLALANRSSETLGIEGELYLRSIYDKRRAVAAILPGVELAPTWRVREGSEGGGYDADLDVPVQAELVVFDANQNINAYWRDVYLIERQRERLLEAQEELLFDVAQVYYAILRAEEQVRVLEGSLQVQGERLRDTQGRQRAGTARPLDVSQTAAQFAATQVQLIEARRLVGDARASLAELLNRPVQASPLVDGLAIPEAPPLPESQIEIARHHRSTLAAAERSIVAAERDVRVAIGAYYPRVSIDLSAFLYRESVPDARTWEGLLAVSFPIFSGGRIDADVRTAWSFLREAGLIESQARRRVTREIDQAIRNLAASKDRLSQLRIQLQAATDAFNQADASYKAGLATNLERITAQDAMLQSQLALATETIDQKLYWLALLRANGTLRETVLEVEPADRATTGPTTAPTTSRE